MKLASFIVDGQNHWGMITENGAIAINTQFPDYATLNQVIQAGALEKVIATANNKAKLYQNFTYDIPICSPGKIICVGVNFPDRNAEYKDGQDAPQHMSLFVRFPGSFSAHGQPILRPKESHKLDYEGEMAIIIGKAGRRISYKDAPNHIAALTICNEGTLRDWVRHAKFNVTQGKNFQNSGAMGPWIVPYQNIQQIENAEIITRVNGEIRQHDNSSRMIFPIAEQIAYISTFTRLEPGDIIVTGTPTGAGARFDPPRYLIPGDEITVEISGIGTLRNIVQDET